MFLGGKKKKITFIMNRQTQQRGGGSNKKATYLWKKRIIIRYDFHFFKKRIIFSFFFFLLLLFLTNYLSFTFIFQVKITNFIQRNTLQCWVKASRHLPSSFRFAEVRSSPPGLPSRPRPEGHWHTQDDALNPPDVQTDRTLWTKTHF